MQRIILRCLLFIEDVRIEVYHVKGERSIELRDSKMNSTE